ncbi:MAG: hypothetical protein AAB074_03235 [Planctomycetota bacterium]|mgnify:CR=1 FL=1
MRRGKRLRVEVRAVAVEYADLRGRNDALEAGDLAEPELLAAARHANPKTESGQVCLAYFYAGSKHLLAGDKTVARDYFQKVVATNQKDYLQHTSAAAELKALGKDE